MLRFRKITERNQNFKEGRGIGSSAAKQAQQEYEARHDQAENGKSIVGAPVRATFADLGRPTPTEKTKVRLAFEINQIVENRKLSRDCGGTVVNHQLQKYQLSNYRTDGFSVERLMNFLTALDRDVDIVIAQTEIKKVASLVTAA